MRRSLEEFLEVANAIKESQHLAHLFRYHRGEEGPDAFGIISSVTPYALEFWLKGQDQTMTLDLCGASFQIEGAEGQSTYIGFRKGDFAWKLKDCEAPVLSARRFLVTP
jgi:hypothetical protein